jgi:predicted 3-demethylubiquinone-9 3-methyltransferase (glyoxalase superfamily)
MEKPMTQIATFLMFSGERVGKAEEAMKFYVSQFADSSVAEIKRWGPGMPGPEGGVMHAAVTLNGRQFMASDSSAPHQFNFTPSISIFISCASDQELGRLFENFAAGGQVLMPLNNYGFSKRFGWVNDRFGVSWQFNLPA